MPIKKYKTADEARNARLLQQMEWRKKHPGYMTNYYRQHPEKQLANRNPEKYKEILKKWRKDNPDYWNEIRKNNEVEHKKMVARSALNNAINYGKIQRQFCEIIDCKLIGEAHHDDHNKPFDVKWLCKAHHEEYHHKVRA